MRIRWWAAVLLLVFHSGIGVTEEALPDWKTIQDNYFSLVGGKTEVVQAPKMTTITLTVDQDEILKSAPLLLKMGFLNDEFTVGDLREHKNKLAAVAALYAAMWTITTQYSTTDIDKSAIICNLQVIDVYGQQQKQPMFSFGFDRATFNKINWNNFEAANLAKVSSAFKFSPWLLANLDD